MQKLIAYRKALVWAALIAGVVTIAMAFVPTQGPTLPVDIFMLAAVVLQGAGVTGMRAHFKARNEPAILVVWAGYAAAVAWLAAWLSALAGVAAGPGGLVYGLLITLPGMALGILLQAVTVAVFVAKERKPATGSSGR